METIADLYRLQKFKKKAEDKNDLKELGSICNALGQLLSQYGRHEEAISEHEMEKRASEALQDKIGEAVACRKIGECYCLLGHFDKALKLQNQYLALAQECNDLVETQRALATLGDTYYTQAESQGVESSRHLLDQAERKFLQALHVCEDLRGSSSLTESEYMAMKGRLLLNLGLVYDVRGAEKESTEYLQKALTIAKQWHLGEEEYLCHFNMANQALRRGRPVLARLSLQQALTFASRLHNKPRLKEVYCQLAIANVSAGEVILAKHWLKKAYKIQTTPEETAKVIKLFKAVSSVEELSERRSACNQDDSEMFCIHEKLGDAFTDIGACCGSYASAINHYQQMVECGERLGLGADKLIPAYVSLAQTYADNRQPDLAISSYHKELELRGNDHEQISRTWLNIAELEERRGDSYKVLSKSYMMAFTHAKKAQHPKLQVQVLRSLMAVQAAFKERRHKEQTEGKLQLVQAKYGLRSDDSLSDEEEEGCQLPDSDAVAVSDHEADLSISDLTDSDKSDEENVHPVLSQMVSTRIRRHKTFKKNEKGETPLHLACISGNLRKVKTLLSEGHPVNVRDHCGWTPLHEAANHDYPAVVEALLDAGADINDRGGAECNGFTPLIDAAACGNIGVMKLLIQRGANVLAKDDKGCTALQALCNWHKDYGDTLSQDSLTEYNSVLSKLQEKVSSVARGRVSASAPGELRNPASVASSLHQPGPSSLTQVPARGSQSASRAAQSSLRRPRHGGVTQAPARSSRCGPESAQSPSSLTQVPARGSQPASRAAQSSLRRPRHGGVMQAPARGSRCGPESAQSPSSQPIISPAPRPVSSVSSEEEEAEEEEEVYQNPQLEDIVASSQTATEAYRSSILALGSSTQRAVARAAITRPSPSPQTQHQVHKPALIDEREMVGDDWLIDDVQPPSRKRRDRSNLGGILSSDSIRPAREGKRARLSTKRKHQGLDAGNDDTSHERRDTVSSVCNSMDNVDFVTNSGSESCSDEGDEPLPVLPRRVRGAETCERLTDNACSVEASARGEELRSLMDSRVGLSAEHLSSADRSRQGGPFPASTPARLARVKVKIEGSVFLIPLPAAEEKTVRWLSEEASQRYSSHFGRRPFLTLSSSDGAILCTDDVLSAVLSHDEQLDGTVLGWDQPALSERYTQACKTLATVRYRNICGILKEAETSHKLCLSGLGLRSTVFLPITRALRGQTSLQQLHLPDNQLGDGGLEGLVTVMADLTGLTHLNLAGNTITAAGLKHLAALISSAANSTAAPPLQLLKMLDISHNPLGSNIADSLCSIVRGLPSLTSLSVASCHLTATLFQHNRPALAACFQGSSLQQLDVSHNNLGTLGVELLLRSVNTQQLTSLELGHTRCDSSPGHLALHLKPFLNQGCALQHLSLEGCCLHRDDVEFLCRLPSEVPGLRKLSLSLNKAVTTDSLLRLLLNSARCEGSQLEHLEAESCSVTSPLSAPSSSPDCPSFLQSLKDKLASPHPLRHLALTCIQLDKEDRENLREVWTHRWTQASVHFSTQHVLLTLKQS